MIDKIPKTKPQLEKLVEIFPSLCKDYVNALELRIDKKFTIPDRKKYRNCLGDCKGSRYVVHCRRYEPIVQSDYQTEVKKYG